MNQFDQEILKLQQQQNQIQENLLVTKNGICKQFLHSSCLNMKCEFSHDILKARRCFKGMSCLQGNQCDFSHMPLCIKYAQKGTRGCDKISKLSKQININQQNMQDLCNMQHVFQICFYFDQGFCPYGRHCQKTHVYRNLCQDYMDGYCNLGSQCKDHHPQNFIQEDFKSEIYNFCLTCEKIGHKKDNCLMNLETYGYEVIKCGLCKKNHNLINRCEQWQKIDDQRFD